METDMEIWKWTRKHEKMDMDMDMDVDVDADMDMDVNIDMGMGVEMDTDSYRTYSEKSTGSELRRRVPLLYKDVLIKSNNK